MVFHDDDDQVAVFDFDELADHLLEQGLDLSPGQLHGCICGLLSAGAPAGEEAGLALMEQALMAQPHGELAGLLLQLYRVTAAALEDEEFDFHPLLPDDEDGIAERTAELAAWCRGFLAGFTHINRSQPGAESAEILGDYAAIAEAGVDEEADEEELEGSYAELVEYLRFATLNIYLDCRLQGPAAGETPVH